MPRRWLLTMLIIVGVTLLAVRPELRSNRADEIKPEVFTLTTGSPRRVSDGRAQIWLSKVEAAAELPGGGVGPAAEVEVNCNGRSYRAWAVSEKQSDELCGCRFRLRETLDTSPPTARIEITARPDYTPNLQAASQPMTSSSRAKRASARTRSRR